MTFILDARLELTAEEERLFERYDIYQIVIYESSEYAQHADAAYGNFDKAAHAPWVPTLEEIGAALWANVAGLSELFFASWSLRITFADLIAGQHIECPELDPIVLTQAHIDVFCEKIAEHLQLALSFDGSEELHEY